MLIQRKNGYYQENHELASSVKRVAFIDITKVSHPPEKEEWDTLILIIAHSKQPNGIIPLFAM